MSEELDLSQIMQQVGSRGLTPKPETVDLTMAMQQVGHRGRTGAVRAQPEPRQ